MASDHIGTLSWSAAASATLSLVLFATTLASPRGAGAEQCDDDRQQRAQAAKQRGWELRDTDPEQAAEAFEEAYELCHDPWFLGILVVVHERADRLSDALDAVDRYLAQGEVEQREQALAARERLRARLGHLEVRSDSPGATVLVDERPLSSGAVTPTTLSLDPGEHQVEARLGQHVAREVVVLAPGEQRRIELSLAAPLPEVAARESEHDPPRRPRGLRTAGWFVLGLGVATAAVGGGVSFVGSERFHVAEAIYSEIQQGNFSSEVELGLMWNRYDEVYEESATTRTAGWATLGVGLAVAISGVMMLVIDAVRARRARSESSCGRWMGLAPLWLGLAPRGD